MHALRRSGAVSWLVAVTLVSVTCLVASPLYHDEGDDRDCVLALVLHDHSAHRIGAPTAGHATDSSHCFICHWHSLRSVRTAVHVVAPASASQPVVADATLGVLSRTLLPRSARAPPLA